MNSVSTPRRADAVRLGPPVARTEDEAGALDRPDPPARNPVRAPRLDGGRVRDPRTAWALARSGDRDGDDENGETGLGWKTSLLLNLILLCAPLGLVIALPPVLECRERAARFGFFAGETLSTCSSRRIELRLKRLDDRIKMLVRGSGR